MLVCKKFLYNFEGLLGQVGYVFTVSILGSDKYLKKEIKTLNSLKKNQKQTQATNDYFSNFFYLFHCL